ncbi:MAG: DUF4230 domain-containing protein [Lachnospiraceae bacterium]|nr:DUF4230 domain-containing protein [Lachnospiraceae bacterium]
MKKIIILLMCIVTLGCTSCKKEEVKELKPEAPQMKSICELATMKCYYHNVAKFKETDAEGILWWQKDRHFWIEYDGIVTLGVEAALVDIKVKGNRVTITMPPAKVLSCEVNEKTLTEDSYIIAKGSADVEAEHQTEAFKKAQKNMKNEAEKDEALLASARQRAEKLLEDYVNNIGELVDKKYEIKWVYVDNEGNKL